MSARQFCRDVSLEREEPLAGTGNAPKRALLLAWPRGKWRAPKWEATDMGAELSAAIAYAMDKALHVALVDRVGESDSLPQLQAQPEAVCASFESESELAKAIRDYADGIVFKGEIDPRVTILCCTDSKKDACCARYGFSTYKALVADADPKRFNILQTTHIGGCRFAASLIVMPNRQRYGRMTAGQVPAFLEALLRNDVFLPAYKGRSDVSEAYQVAEIAALEWAKTKHSAVRDVQIELPEGVEDPAEGSEIDVTAHVGPTKLGIRLEAKRFHIQGNCSIVANNGGMQKTRWCHAQTTAI